MSDQDNSQQEPTMEEILASIRRIISEDGDAGDEEVEAEEPEAELEPEPEPEPEPDFDAVPEPEPEPDFDAVPEPEPEPEPEEDVFDLIDVAEEEPVAEDDLMMVEAEEEFVPEPEPEPEPVAAEPADDSLLDDVAAGAAMAAFGTLARSATMGTATSIEQVVLAALKPLLKQWLDENLPGIVEELVQREVERVSSGGVK